jgi:uncharacterized iron-regulated membrane protein
MTAWRRWVQQPQRLWIRRALFQVHLWVGIGVGLYILLISVTGSAIVYRRELSRKYSRKPVFVTASGPQMSAAELKRDAEQLYPGYKVADYFEAKKPIDPVSLVLVRNKNHLQRLFNPYTGADLGDPMSRTLHTIDWLSDLHDNLLGGTTGRFVNGIGSIFSTALALTGAVIWWPGIKSWRRALGIKWNAKFARFNYDLHSALGFWCFLFIFMWGLTGIYLSFEKPFYAFFNLVDPNDRFTDDLLEWLEFLHFGRFGWFAEGVWVVLGLVPAVLFVTGAVMWWNRVLRKGARWPE